MLNRNIIDILHNYNFNMLRSNSREYLFFGRMDIDNFQTVVLVDDVILSTPLTDKTTPADKSALHVIKDTLERTLLLKGYQNVDILFIISTKEPYSYKDLADENIPFWIIDSDRNRIISYNSEDEDFLWLRNDVEQCLSPSYKKESLSLKERISSLWKQPIFTLSIVFINVLIFIYMDLFCTFEGQTYIKLMYSNAWDFIYYKEQYYRLFTSMFLHADMVHIFSNMVTLCAIGYQLEVSFGHFKYLLTYMLSGLVASLLSFGYHFYLGEPVISMGASGAVFGIFGAYAIYSIFNRKENEPVPALKIGFVALVMLLNGMTSSYIDNAAHLGGLVAGSIISFISCICRKNKI